MPITIVLADDHNLVRKGLRGLLENNPDITILGEAEDGIAAVKLAKDLVPDIVIMDIGMPKLNGIDAIEPIVRNNPEIAVITLSMHREERFITGAFQAGAKSYILKDSLFDELMQAIQAVHKGQFYLSPAIAHIAIKSLQGNVSSGDMRRPASTLTTREREVLQLLTEGKKTSEIGTQLNISTKTVESHRRNIMEKLNLKQPVELIKYALREGVVPLDAWLAPEN
jgi:DNA-binding NarL/FixJ family response regulator